MNSADRKRIKSAVLDTLNAYGKPLPLPLPIKSIVKHFKNIRLIPYSKQMQRRGLSYQEMLDFTGTDDACTDYDGKSKFYIIYYNDCDKSRTDTNRYRWNIAHELGHIRLEHHKRYPDSRLYRNRLSESTYKALESEADMFAAYILVPHIVLSCLNITADCDIARLCRISNTAASYRENDMRMWKKNRESLEEYDYLILSHFSAYVEAEHKSKRTHKWLSSHRVCRICDGALHLSSQDFCPFCGTAITPKYLDRSAIMQYPGVDTDADNRALECPNCGNTDLYKSGNFCIICGHSLVNYCSEADSSDQSAPCRHDEPLPGNARYCPYCGSKTTFYNKGYLSSCGKDDPEDLDELPF